MKLTIIIAAILLLASPVLIEAKETQTDIEISAVRRAVETYLYSEEPQERRAVTHPKTKIYSVDERAGKLKETPIPTPTRKLPKGAKHIRTISRQKVVSIDVAGGGASVKVETDLSPDDMPRPKHTQYISLLKIGGEWKIVSILMP